MRILFALLLALTLLEAASVRWQHNYQKAINAAKTDNKPLLVYLYLPGCKTCNYMHSNVFNDKAVAAFMAKNYIAVKLYPNDKGLPEKFRAEISPVFHFVNSQDSEMIESVMGGKNAEKFLELLKKSLNTYNADTKQ